MIPKGFRFSAVEAAIKKPGRVDFGLVECPAAATVAGVFTRNKVVAAPVVVCRELLPGGTAGGILVNAGNANACTGAQGLTDARRLIQAAAAVLGSSEVPLFPCSTGVIGLPLPVERMERALPALVAGLGADPEPFARSIMTTDGFPKVARRSFEVGGNEVRVLGVAKGAGMIRPDMATMLGFVLTDASVTADALQQVLHRVVDRTFNRITVDGDTSTNDTVLALASGQAAGEQLDFRASGLAALEEAMLEVCGELARMIVRDGEGATKAVDVTIQGAVSDEAALAIAWTIAESPLVKTAIHGADPNWGRIAGALGRSRGYRGGGFDITIGGQAVVKESLAVGPDAELTARAVMQGSEYEIVVVLQEGSGSATVTTCDLTAEYVKINADYRT